MSGLSAAGRLQGSVCLQDWSTSWSCMSFPRSSGQGFRFCRWAPSHIPLRLLETHSFPNGITKLRYKVQRDSESSLGTTSTVGT
jgi:hypothetical protein